MTVYISSFSFLCSFVSSVVGKPGVSHLNMETIDKTLPSPEIGWDKAGCRKAQPFLYSNIMKIRPCSGADLTGWYGFGNIAHNFWPNERLQIPFRHV